ncbi:MAG: hypothetical protein AAFP86_12695 [Planctomycetota bacterium]
MIVRIVETGLANVASVRAALQRAGVTAASARCGAARTEATVRKSTRQYNSKE